MPRSSATPRRRRPTTRRSSACSSASPARCRGRKLPLWRLPTVLLDWQFAPAWPRVAAWPAAPRSASSSALPDSTAASIPADAGFTVASRGDLGSIVFEPEATDRSTPMTIAQLRTRGRRAVRRAGCCSARWRSICSSSASRWRWRSARRPRRPGTATCSCASSASPTPCRRPMPICCAARSTPTAQRSTMRSGNTAPRRTRSARRCGSEPFDAEAMRAAMAKTRAARQNFDQIIQGVFAFSAAQMSPAGRSALADWPPGRKTTSNSQ